MKMIKTETKVEDWYCLPENGKVIIPSGFSPEQVGSGIYASLRDYERCIKNGYAIPYGVGFIVNLCNRRSFSPDAAFYIGKPGGGRFLQGSPIFAVDVRSKDDYGKAVEEAMAVKRADYFAAGTLALWDVDVLAQEEVRVYRVSNPEKPQVYRRGEIAEAEPAVPGWSMPVDDLFTQVWCRK